MVSLWAWAFGGVVTKFFHLGLARRTVFDETPGLLLLSTGLFCGGWAGAGYVLEELASTRMERIQKMRDAISAQEGGQPVNKPPFLRVPAANGSSSE
ncbi:uncharacterized protein V2V93DRAFT_373557 [Kockiozyma suomiensis]|uniref:uncharacterized protein n=1 Tax=Kockiozyma suomiensis TaxID=1337062 RepID=UPI0033439F1E